MDSNDELTNLHVIKFAMKHGAQLQKLKRIADGQPRKITDVILVTKLKEFARGLGIGDSDFKCLNGWLTRFKERRGIAS